ALALQVTMVQNWMIDRVTGYLNANSIFTTDIGRIKLTWWDALELKNFTVRDHKDSLMLGAETLYADFALLSLLSPGDPTIDAVHLTKTEVNLLTHVGDTTMNINLSIKDLGTLFGPSGSSKSGPRFHIGAVDLSQTEFSLVNFNVEPITEGFD